jgi:hypothetical protein
LIAYKIIKKKQGLKKAKQSENCHHNYQISAKLLQEGINDGLFRREYWMSPRSYCKLFNLLRVDLLLKDIGRTRPDCINPEAKVMFTVRWLAGGQYINQCRKHGIRKPTINAINKNQHIDCLKWPDFLTECDKIGDKWVKPSGPSG